MVPPTYTPILESKLLGIYCDYFLSAIELLGHRMLLRKKK